MTAATAKDGPDLLADLTSAERHGPGRRQLNDTVAMALTRWRDLYVAAWRTGTIGDEAKPYASDINLQQSAP